MNVRGMPAILVTVLVLSLSNTGALGALTDNGGGLIYDSSTDLTWYQESAGLNWDQANAWAQNLTAGELTGWRLPSYPQTPGYSFDPSGPTDVGELGQLWAVALGNTPGNNYTNPGPFDPTKWFAGGYWTNDVYGNHLATMAALYSMGNGTVFAGTTGALAFAFAVHAGNVGAPEPATLSLLALGGLMLLKRRKR